MCVKRLFLAPLGTDGFARRCSLMHRLQLTSAELRESGCTLTSYLFLHVFTLTLRPSAGSRGAGASDHSNNTDERHVRSTAEGLRTLQMLLLVLSSILLAQHEKFKTVRPTSVLFVLKEIVQ